MDLHKDTPRTTKHIELHTCLVTVYSKPLIAGNPLIAGKPRSTGNPN